MEYLEKTKSGTGIFRKVLNLDGISHDNWYVMEELSVKDKTFLDKRNAEMMEVEWDVDETTCIQELYSNLYYNPTLEFFHRGYLYGFNHECLKGEPEQWQIFIRDLSNPKVAYNSVWWNEPYLGYPNLPSLIFEFKLQNDGRTIAEYCCDYWKQPRMLVPEPVDMSLVRKVWRH